jgi:multiple sugar transport system ATP-binding protein
MARVRLENLVKVFGPKVVAVDGVSLEVGDKEFLTLVGPSGCGKSTTLRMIAGLERPSRGEIYFDDRPVTDVPPQARNIAMVFQNYALYPHMTVRENVGYCLKLQRLPRAEIEERVQATGALLGIDHLLDRRIHQLSGGQQQRVALGRAIIRRPTLFLLDEPLSNLDAKLRVQMRIELIKLHKQLGTTTIYVTHDQLEAMTMSDRLALMHNGRLVQCGSPAEVYARPATRFAAEFVGTPSINVLEAQLGEEGASLVADLGFGRLVLPPDLAAQVPAARRGARVDLGIRAEDVRVGSDEPIAKARVSIIENAGADLYVYLELNGTGLTARCSPDLGLTVGDTVGLTFNPYKAHLFDPESGRAFF